MVNKRVVRRYIEMIRIRSSRGGCIEILESHTYARSTWVFHWNARHVAFVFHRRNIRIATHSIERLILTTSGRISNTREPSDVFFNRLRRRSIPHIHNKSCKGPIQAGRRGKQMQTLHNTYVLLAFLPCTTPTLEKLLVCIEVHRLTSGLSRGVLL